MLPACHSRTPLDPVTAAFFWRLKADRLLKVDFVEDEQWWALDDSINPGYLMVPSNGTREVRINLSNASSFGLSIDEYATFYNAGNPLELKYDDEYLIIEGLGQPGESSVDLRSGNATLVTDILGLDVKAPESVDIRIYYVTELDPNNSSNNIEPSLNIDIDALETYLNDKIWFYQANVSCHVEGDEEIFVDYDFLPVNDALDYIAEDNNIAEYQEVVVALGDVDPNQINILVVEATDSATSPGSNVPGTRNIMISSEVVLGNDVDINQVIAHEVGHALGIGGHAEDGSDHDPIDIMFWETAGGENVDRADWNSVNE